MRGRSPNLITISFSPSLITHVEVNFYLIVWPLSLFFGLLPLFRQLPVYRKWPHLAHDTPRYLCYVIAKEFGSLKHLSFLPTSAQVSNPVILIAINIIVFLLSEPSAGMRVLDIFSVGFFSVLSAIKKGFSSEGGWGRHVIFEKHDFRP